MVAFVKSVELIQTTFTSTTSLETNTVNLSKGQDETKCVPFATMRFTSNASDNPSNRSCSIEMIDNAGTAAATIRRDGNNTAGATTVEITVVEFGSNVTVQQNSTAVSLTSTSATATITAVTEANSFVTFGMHAGAGDQGGDDHDDYYVQARFNSTTQIAFERRAGGPADWEIYWYVVESDGTDFLTEYVEDSWTSGETGPTGITLSNSVTLANAFVVATYESGEASDDQRDGVANVALTATTTLTWYRNHGGSPSATGTIGVWVVRASSLELDVQRFATSVDDGSNTTFNQAITEVDDTRTLVLGSQHVACGGNGQPVSSDTTGSNNDDWMHTILLTSTTNVQLQRLIDTSITGSNNNVRFEVIEFELESAVAGGYTAGSLASTGVGV